MLKERHSEPASAARFRACMHPTSESSSRTWPGRCIVAPGYGPAEGESNQRGKPLQVLPRMVPPRGHGPRCCGWRVRGTAPWQVVAKLAGKAGPAGLKCFAARRRWRGAELKSSRRRPSELQDQRMQSGCILNRSLDSKMRSSRLVLKRHTGNPSEEFVRAVIGQGS